MRKSLNIFVLLAAFPLLALPIAAQAQFQYTIADGQVTITKYTGSGGNVTIPSTINDDSVTAIGTNAFEGNGFVTGVTIPDSVTTIGDSAFAGCALTTLAIPDSVTTIGDSAFKVCYALTTVTIPDSVTNIGDGAFFYCFALTGFAVNASNPSYASAAGVLFDKTLDTLIQYPSGRAGSYTIPNSVTSIGDSAFTSATLTNVTIPDSVTNIGATAFWGSSILSVSIPDSVINIGDQAFGYCSALESITVDVPGSVISIGDYAFEGCALTNVVIPNSVTSIGIYAFSECSSLSQVFFQGNAPSVDGVVGSEDTSVFSLDGTGKAYYVPGATGWGATFGGWPTAQWYQPQPQILGVGLAVGSLGFQFTISWATNTPVVVQASSDLQNWTPVSTNTLVNGVSAFVDSSCTNYPQRFYRLSVEQ
jgi:hypothetical protein